MRLRFCQAMLLAAAIAVGAAPTNAVALESAASYHGFTIELTGFGSPAETEAALVLVKEQIGMVERVGLRAAQINFFRGLKLRIAGNLRGYFGIYDRGVISLAPAQIDGHNPTLLHEYMHALHDKRLPGGFANMDIEAAYRDAYGVKRYEGTNSAYFLTNSHEFFAVTATLYLWGSLPVNRPYARAAIKDAQPGYYKFLEGLFGAR